MKKILLLLGALLSLSAMAQDVVVMQNGDEIQCKLIEIGTEQIKYKRWTNPDGPVFVEDRDDVFMIKYENGEKEVFGVKTVSPQKENSISASVTAIPNLMFDKKSTSGLSSGEVKITEVDARRILGDEWKEFEMYKNKRHKGKSLLVWGIVCRSLSIPVSGVAIVKGKLPLYMTGVGLRLGGTALMVPGIVKMAKGQRGCKQIVKRHESSAIGFNPDFDFGVGLNGMTFRMSF